jgi:hypothetical protein
MGLAHLYFWKVSVFVFPEFPCRFRFRRKLLTRFLFRFHLKYSVSVPFPHNTAFVSFFCSLFPFFRKQTESFLAVFNPMYRYAPGLGAGVLTRGALREPPPANQVQKN